MVRAGQLDISGRTAGSQKRKAFKGLSTHGSLHITPIEIAINNLKCFYEEGKGSLARDGQRMEYGVLKRGKKSLSQQEHQRKARAFANTYGNEQFDELLLLCVQGKYVLSVSHIKCLLAVTPISRRTKLQKNAIKHCWSKARLQLEIRRLFGSRRPMAGRRQMRLANSAEINPRISQFAERWRRFRKDVDEFAETKPQLTTMAFKRHLVKIDKEFLALVKRTTDLHKSKNRPGSR